MDADTLLSLGLNDLTALTFYCIIAHGRSGVALSNASVDPFSPRRESQRTAFRLNLDPSGVAVDWLATPDFIIL